MINLAQARELVHCLEAEDQDAANNLLVKIFLNANQPFFNEIGTLTRELHNSIIGVKLNPNISELTSTDIPHAMERLNFVIEKTESAVNRTMDAMDVIMPLAEHLQSSLSKVHQQLDQLISGKIQIESFKASYHQIDSLLLQIEADNTILYQQLSEILIAQDFQDLTGQVIIQVIDLFKDIESQLVNILITFKAADEVSTSKPDMSNIAEGPVVNEKERRDKQVLDGQDEVDSLLSSLGF